MTKLPTLEEKKFKAEHRKDVCSECPIRVPCGNMDSICELVTPCAVCEIRDTCVELCDQMKFYLIRGENFRRDIPMSQLESKIRMTGEGGDAESVITYKYLKDKEADVAIGGPIFSEVDIPWGAISDRDKQMVIDHFKNQLTYDEMSTKFKVSSKRIHQIILGDRDKNEIGALETLRYYAKYQRAYKDHEKDIPEDLKIILKLHFVDFKKPNEIEDLLNLTQKQVSRQLIKGRDFLDGTSKPLHGNTYSKETVMLTQEEELVAYLASRIYGQFGAQAYESVKAAIEIVKQTQKQMRKTTEEENDAD